MANGKGELEPNEFDGDWDIIDLNACCMAYFFTMEETVVNATDNATPTPIQKTGEPMYDDGGGMGGRVPVPVDVFSLLVEDDTLAKPFALNPSKAFLDPRGATAATRSLGLLAPPRAAPPVEAAVGGAAPGSPRKRAAAERTGRRGDAEQEEARTRLSMPPGRAALRGGAEVSLSPSLARSR